MVAIKPTPKRVPSKQEAHMGQTTELGRISFRTAADGLQRLPLRGPLPECRGCGNSAPWGRPARKVLLVHEAGKNASAVFLNVYGTVLSFVLSSPTPPARCVATLKRLMKEH